MTFWASPDVGDWVKTTSRLPINLTDHLTSGGLPAGTSGVVTGRVGGRLEVTFDAGFGTVRAWASSNDLRVTRRGGGENAFTRRADRLMLVRLAALLTLAGPFLVFLVQHVWETHSTEGLIAAIAIGMVESTGELIMTAINNPIQTLIYLAVAWWLQRLAFGR